MDEQIGKLIESAGALAETIMIFYKAFLTAGFTDKQAVCFCSKIVQVMIEKAYEKGNNT